MAFLGGTIGNFKPAERKQFLADVAARMVPGDGLLLGTDLVKDVARLEAAYDDTCGRHRRVQQERPRRHQPRAARRLRPRCASPTRALRPRQRVDRDAPGVDARPVGHIADLDLTVAFADGEEMRTEISAKFRREGVETELAGAGLRLTEWWTDPAGDFALVLAARPQSADPPRRFSFSARFRHESVIPPAADASASPRRGASFRRAGAPVTRRSASSSCAGGAP